MFYALGNEEMGKMKKFWIRTLTLLAVLFSVLLFEKIDTQAAPLLMPDGTVFDPVFYADTYPDLRVIYAYDANLLWKHYTACGKAEGRLASDGSPAVGAVLVYPDGSFFDLMLDFSRKPKHTPLKQSSSRTAVTPE